MTEEQKYIVADTYRKYKESCGVDDHAHLIEIEDAVYEGLEKGYDNAVQEIYKWLEENIKENISIIGDGIVSLNFGPLLEKYKETFKK